MYSGAIHVDQNLIALGYSDPKSGELFAMDLYETIDSVNSASLIKHLSNSNSKGNLKGAAKNIFYSTSSRFTIVPSRFYKSGEENNWIKPHFKKEETEIIFNKYIPEIESYILFPIEIELKNRLKSEIGHIEFSHHFASLISIYHLYYLEENNQQTFIHFHANQFTIALFKGTKMLLFNTYELRSWEDVLYYCYYAIQQYGLKPNETKINLGGSYLKMEELTVAFQKYSKFIYRMKAKSIAQLEPENENKLLSIIFDLQCG